MRQESGDAIDLEDDNDNLANDEVPQTVSGHMAESGRGKSLMISVKNVVRLITGSCSKVAGKAT